MILLDYKLKKVNIRGIDLILTDYINSSTIEILDYEFNKCNEYNIIEEINFKKNDIILDIGANVGTTTIYLAKKFPQIKIYAFEPMYCTYKCLMRNLYLNNIDRNNVKIFNLAVTAPNVDFFKIYFDEGNSGGSSGYRNLNRGNNHYNAKCISLDKIFSKFNINKVKLLKIDCEGGEFDILYNSKNLDKIEYITGETHSYDNNENHRDRLLPYLENFIKKENISFVGF